jgi:hypothetical protein
VLVRTAKRGVAIAILAIAPLALAQQGNAVRIDYEAPRGCPDIDAFTSEVHARSPRIRVESDAPRTLSVRLAMARGKFEGTFTLRDADGTARQRRVTGSRCDEVVSGLALIAAVAIDPDAASGVPSAEPSTTEAPVDAGVAEAAPPPTPRPVETEEWSVSFWADAELVTGSAPPVLFAVPMSLEVARTTKSLFAPAVRLRFERTIGSARLNSEGADFTFTIGDLDLCPIAWSPWRLRLQGCARSELGALESIGVGVAPIRSAVRPYLAFGPVLDFRLRIYGPLFLNANGGLLFATVRDRYFLEPSSTVFEVPVAAARAGIGAGATLW